uniref:Uncharacterized protein n=1 Tax=Trypanosoma vivax (strain Y486) TaxID=1055687 RepID=G0TTD7_TRYVY|nr:hypothetical protein, unlikely [Trypanosoma vivax Y486]
MQILPKQRAPYCVCSNNPCAHSPLNSYLGSHPCDSHTSTFSQLCTSPPPRFCKTTYSNAVSLKRKKKKRRFSPPPPFPLSFVLFSFLCYHNIIVILKNKMSCILHVTCLFM